MLNEYLVVETKDQRALEEELNKLKLTFSKNDKFLIDIKDKNVHQIIKDIQTELTSIRILKPTLEEAYIQIIEQSHDGNHINKLEDKK